MGRVWSVDLPNHVGQQVVIAGWLLLSARHAALDAVIRPVLPGAGPDRYSGLVVR